MSYRYNNALVKPGLNTLVSPPPVTYTYELWSWGQNSNGQLGLNNQTDYYSPKQAGTLTNWSSVSCGNFNVISIKTDGTLWGWGRNAEGQLGLGNTTGYSSPKQIGVLTNWLQSASGMYHTLAIKTDGTLWSWGKNTQGQLGLNNTTYYSSPKQVGSSTNWSKIAASALSSMAIKTDGTLWTWGYNQFGTLGLGSSTYGISSPNQVGALTNWANVYGNGGYSSVAIKTDGTLWAWGYSVFGQLGLGNTTNYSSPKQVGSLTSWSSASQGNYFTLAIKTDGSLWSWGYNSDGQLGLGNTTNYSSPKQIGALNNWSKVTAGLRLSSQAIKTDGTLWSWGRNDFGQLGLGNTTYYSSPKQVGNLTTWYLVIGGRSFATALKY